MRGICQQAYKSFLAFMIVGHANKLTPPTLTRWASSHLTVCNRGIREAKCQSLKVLKSCPNHAGGSSSTTVTNRYGTAKKTPNLWKENVRVINGMPLDKKVRTCSCPGSPFTETAHL